jgi:hypothetical protein
MKQMRKWIANYENSRHSKQGLRELKESWISSKYDFTDLHVREEYVPEIGCSVGGCISALRKSWRAYYIAGRNGEPRNDVAHRIVSIQSALGIERSQFPGLEGMDVEFEEMDSGELNADELQALREERAESGGNHNLNSGTTELYTDEWSEEDKQLLKEERESEDDW